MNKYLSFITGCFFTIVFCSFGLGVWSYVNGGATISCKAEVNSIDLYNLLK